MNAGTAETQSELLPVGAISGVEPEDAERYLLALAAINLSVYDWDIETGTIEHPPLGREVRQRWAEQPSTADGWASVLHPDDLDGFRAAIRAHGSDRS